MRAALNADVPDAVLMRRVQEHDDDEAFRALYDRFARRAQEVARALVHDRVRAEDVVQEAFLAVWRHRAMYDPARGGVAAWLLGTVRNRSIDALRAHGRHDRRTAHGEDPADGRRPAPGDLEAATLERDEAARLRRMLKQLPPDQRDVIVLAYYGELSSSEIAAQLDVPIGTIKGRMRLGLGKLRA